MFRAYTSDPILVIVDVNPRSELEIPTQAYISIESRPEEVRAGGRRMLLRPRIECTAHCVSACISHLIVFLFVCVIIGVLGVGSRRRIGVPSCMC